MLFATIRAVRTPSAGSDRERGRRPARAAAGVFRRVAFCPGCAAIRRAGRRGPGARISRRPPPRTTPKPEQIESANGERRLRAALRQTLPPHAQRAAPPRAGDAPVRAVRTGSHGRGRRHRGQQKRQAKAKAKRDALRKQLENDKKEAEGFFNEISTDEGKTIPSDKLADLLQRAIGDDHAVTTMARPWS